MKKLLYLFMVLLAFAGCKKEDELNFEDRPEVRMNQAISELNTTLTSSPNGWIGTMSTEAGGGYGFYMTFDGTNQVVQMIGDMTDASATTLTPSTYRVKANAGAELIFDTYNYISLLSDPNPSSFGGATGTGLKSDVEFLFERSSGDSLVLTGKKYRQVLKMVKATAAQKTAYTSGELKTAIDKVKAFFVANKYPYIDIVSGSATIKAGITINTTNGLAAGKRITFTGVLADGATVISGVSKYGFKVDDFDLVGNGLSYNGITFVRFGWKDATTLVVYDSTGKEYIVKNSAAPLTPLYILLGAGYNSVAVPNATTYPGWSADFTARRATAATSITRWSITTPRGALRLQGINMSFNNVTKRMVAVFDTPDGTSAFSLTFNYTYTRSDAGVFKFTLGVLGGNEDAIAGDLATILAQRLNVDSFTVDYFTNPTTGALMAQFKSVEHPDFIFTGNI